MILLMEMLIQDLIRFLVVKVNGKGTDPPRWRIIGSCLLT